MKYKNVRSHLIYVDVSMARGARWVVVEANDGLHPTGDPLTRPRELWIPVLVKLAVSRNPRFSASTSRAAGSEWQEVT